jgi:hypothetical protein
MYYLHGGERATHFDQRSLAHRDSTPGYRHEVVLKDAIKNCLNMIDLSVDPPLFDGNELFFVGNAGLRLHL